ACRACALSLLLAGAARCFRPAVRPFACPECLLGLDPGWGGTQLIPPLVGADTAIEFIVENPLRQNRVLDGRRAHELGFADRLLEPAEFVDESIAYAVELATRPPEAVRGVKPEQMPLGELFDLARSRVDDG